MNTEELKGLVGKEKDIILAERFGVSRERVRQIRKQLNIPKCFIRYDKGNVYNAPPDTLKTVINMLNTNFVSAVRRKYPDFSVAALNKLKEDNNITSNKGKDVRSLKALDHLNEEEKDVLIGALGKESDYSLAKQYSVCLSTIASMRRKLSVKPFRVKWSKGPYTKLGDTDEKNT